MTTHEEARKAFDRLKSNSPVRAQREYEIAIAKLLKDYNTTNYENRFLVGGAVEIFTCALLRSAGIKCVPVGAKAKRGDLRLPSGTILSVKGSFAGRGEITLINKKGSGERKWETPTLFVIAGTGIVFGSRDMVEANHINSKDDSIDLTADGLRHLIKDEENVFCLEIAQKPGKEKAQDSYIASHSVARGILDGIKTHVLFKACKGLDLKVRGHSDS